MAPNLIFACECVFQMILFEKRTGWWNRLKCECLNYYVIFIILYTIVSSESWVLFHPSGCCHVLISWCNCRRLHTLCRYTQPSLLCPSGDFRGDWIMSVWYSPVDESTEGFMPKRDVGRRSLVRGGRLLGLWPGRVYCPPFSLDLSLFPVCHAMNKFLPFRLLQYAAFPWSQSRMDWDCYKLWPNKHFLHAYMSITYYVSVIRRLLRL